MRSKLIPPEPWVLLESMRAIGYSASTAIADLVDNSITAGASAVSIRFEAGISPAIAVLDNGTGMTEAELEQAMRHGSRSPNEKRPLNDLGRFGLGLKTASMSQCRRLIVISKKNNRLNGMVWDLDEVAKARNWSVGIFDPKEIANFPYVEDLKKYSSGTLVLWQNIDVLAAGDPGDGSVLGEKMQHVAQHLGLVFHRFLASRSQPLSIDLNMQPVDALDPFLENDGSIVGEEETIRVDGSPVVLRAFTLPHISRLNKEQIEKAGGEAGLRRQQGFYVYRNLRLIVWGTWFRLFRQEELTKLTRVRVDVPNSLDHLWGLDIKKSLASPPASLRARLAGLVPTMVRPSRQAHQYRGYVAKNGIRPIWRRVDDRNGIRYEIDIDHPLIAALRSSADNCFLQEIDNILRIVSESLPVEALYNDRANDRIGHRVEKIEDEKLSEQLEELARQMLAAFIDRPEERQRLLAGLKNIEPFALHPNLASKLQERLAVT